MEYYTTADVLAITEVGRATLDRWARAFRDTPMVIKSNDRTLYSDHFIHFLEQRKDALGPTSLPPVALITQLYQAWHDSHSVAIVAEKLNLPVMIVNQHLTHLGLLEVTNGQQEN